MVFVADEHDSIYAIDADGGQVLWQDSPLGTFNVPGTGNTVTVTTVPSGDVNSGDISPEIGITGTPAIDASTGYMYVVAKTKEVYSNDTADPHYVNTLYKIDIANGTWTKTVIADTTYTAGGSYVFNSGPYVDGTGDGAINVGGQSRVYFNSLRQMFRPAVSLNDGQVVLGSASHGDNGPYHGWMLTYDENSLALTGVLNTSPNAGLAGIWQGGRADRGRFRGLLLLRNRQRPVQSESEQLPQRRYLAIADRRRLRRLDRQSGRRPDHQSEQPEHQRLGSEGGRLFHARGPGRT